MHEPLRQARVGSQPNGSSSPLIQRHNEPLVSQCVADNENGISAAARAGALHYSHATLVCGSRSQRPEALHSVYQVPAFFFWRNINIIELMKHVSMVYANDDDDDDDKLNDC